MKKRVLVLADKTSFNDKEGPFTSPSGHWYRKFAKTNNLHADFLYLTDDKYAKLLFKSGNEYVPTNDLKRAAREIKSKIKSIRPDAIITCGKAALAAITDETDLERNHCYVLWDENKIPVIPTYHPNHLFVKDSRVFWISKAFTKAADLVDGATPTPYELVTNNNGQQAKESLLRCLTTKAEISIDIETTRDDCTILTAIGWSEGPYKAYAITPDCTHWNECLKLYYKIIEDPEIQKIGQNFIYDSQALWKRDGVNVKGRVWDTMHCANVLYCDIEKSLGDLGRLYLYETPWKGSWSSTGESLRIYNAQDIVFTYLVRLAQEDHLRYRGCFDYFNDLHPNLFVPAFDMSVRGIPMNMEKRAEMLKAANQVLEEPLAYCIEFGTRYVGPKEVKKKPRDNANDTPASFRGLMLPEEKLNRKQLDTLLAPYLQGAKPGDYYIAKKSDEKKYGHIEGNLYKKAYREEIELRPQTFNPGSATQVKKVLLNAKVKLPKVKTGTAWKESSNKDAMLKVLARNKDKEEVLQFIRYMLMIRAGLKLISSYLTSPIDADGRFRYYYNIEGTKSGRSASKKTSWETGGNSQNMPRDPFRGIKVKRVFEADPGYTLVQCDLSAAEARIVAWLSEDDDTLAAMDKGEDLHLHTLALLYDEDYYSLTEEDPRRQKVKPIRHGGNYDMGPATLASTMLKGGVDVSVNEAKRLLDKFHAEAPKVRGVFHKNVQLALANEKRLITPFGRIRHFTGKVDSNTLRDAYSFVPQSTVPHIINLMWLWVEEQPETKAGDVQVLQMGHDALLYQVKDDLVDDFVGRYIAKTDTIKFSIGKYKDVHIPSDAEIGRSWGEMEKWKPKKK